ncbi:MAG TPA: VOC family protein [bacterium]|jgi:hypothetical protein
MPNPLTHFEFMTNDPDRISGFYSNLFGWEMHHIPEMGYTIIKTGHVPGGGLGTPREGQDTGVTLYLDVADIDSMLRKASGLGWNIEMPKYQIDENVGSMALISDFDGNILGLFQGPESADRQPPAENEPGREHLGHFEVGITDLEKAKKWYAGLFDWEIEDVGGIEYSILKSERPPFCGLFKVPGNIPPYAMFYVQTDDIERRLGDAVELGGKVIVEKTKISDHYGYFAIFSDPDGNNIGLSGQK